MGRTTDEPRFEYRVWNPPAPVMDAVRHRGRHTGRSQVRDCYVLGHDPDLNAKIREDRLEVKRLLDRRSGFERWEAAWSADAPFESSVIKRLYDEFGLPIRDGGAGPHTVDELVSMLRESGHLHVAWVSKRREFFEIEGASAELTEVAVEAIDRTMTTAAVEGLDHERLVRLGEELGITDLDNIPVDRAVLAAVEGRDRAD